MTYNVLMGTLNPTHSLTHRHRTGCPVMLNNVEQVYYLLAVVVWMINTSVACFVRLISDSAYAGTGPANLHSS